MNLTQVNYLNVFLMLLSVVLAYILPFELFLFSYAVLGPLHYLTEIGWLHRRKYFTTQTGDYKWLIGIGAVILCLFLTDKVLIQGPLSSFFDDPQQVINTMRSWGTNLIIIAFVGGLSMVIFNDGMKKLAFTLIVSGLLLLVSDLRTPLIILAILLPTLIHTTIFMVAFILYGSLRSKSVSGYISVGVFVLCCVVFFVFDPGIENYKIHSTALDSFLKGDFMVVNQIMLDASGSATGPLEHILYSPIGIKIQRFIAFSYTYHYLNWFSKTHVIHWHEVGRRWLILSGVLWVVSVGLYFYDFSTGLAALFMLSLLHVFLEFPLNYRSIIGIGRMITGKAG